MTLRAWLQFWRQFVTSPPAAGGRCIVLGLLAGFLTLVLSRVWPRLRDALDAAWAVYLIVAAGVVIAASAVYAWNHRDQ